MAPCAVSDTVVITPDIPIESSEAERAGSFNDVAELVAGYVDCMQESVRYLVEVERYPESHPAVEALRDHLRQYQKQLVSRVLMLRPSCQSQRPDDS